MDDKHLIGELQDRDAEDRESTVHIVTTLIWEGY